MACVRVKRALNVETGEPSPAIVVKRRRLQQGDGSIIGDPKAAGDFNVDSDEFKAVFKFVGTVRSKEENIDPHISKSIVNECKASSASNSNWRRSRNVDESAKKVGVKRRTKNDDRGRRREMSTKDQKKASTTSTEARFRLINAMRGVEECGDVSGNDQVRSEFDEAFSGLYTLYDVEEVQSMSSSLKTKDLDQITCNGVTMVCEEKPAEKYVYDLYFLHNCNVEMLELTQDPFCIEPCFNYDQHNSPNGDDLDSDLETAEDEDDSNDESNWRNDYPEEDDDFEKDYDYYRDYGDVNLDEQLVEQFKNYTIGTTSIVTDTAGEGNESSRSQEFEEDLRLHGRIYAEYKARMKFYVDSDTSNDILTDPKSSNTFK